MHREWGHVLLHSKVHEGCPLSRLFLGATLLMLPSLGLFSATRNARACDSWRCCAAKWAGSEARSILLTRKFTCKEWIDTKSCEKLLLLFVCRVKEYTNAIHAIFVYLKIVIIPTTNLYGEQRRDLAFQLFFPG